MLQLKVKTQASTLLERAHQAVNKMENSQRAKLLSFLPRAITTDAAHIDAAVSNSKFQRSELQDINHSGSEKAPYVSKQVTSDKKRKN